MTTEIVPRVTLAARYSIPSKSHIHRLIEELKGKAVRLSFSLIALGHGTAACQWDLLATGTQTATVPKLVTSMA